jgi:pyruvate kinase
VEYADLCHDLQPGDHVTLGDGGLVLRIDECGADRARAHVVSGGRLQGRPGVHLPAERLSLSTPTPDDLALLDVVTRAGADFVAVSFVRDAEDVKEVKAALGPPPHPLVVAKIETRAAVEALDSILEVTDAVMVARGDLGTDCPIEEVPHLQKRIVRACVEWGKPVITATQMLESMINSPMPTRAEASDVANAVFDGTDAVMLSGETAIGRDPAHVVRTMVRLVTRAERDFDHVAWEERLARMERRAGIPETLAITAATTHAAWAVAVELDAKAVVCCTRSGLTARAMARFRPPCPLAGCSYDELTVRQLALSWGVRPVRVDVYESTDEMVWFSVEAVVREGLARRGDVVVVLAGAPEDEEPSTDVLRVVRVR